VNIKKLERLPKLAVLLSTLMLGAAALVRLVLRDRVPYVATLHYVTPNVVLALGFLACGAWWRRRERGRVVAVACGALGVFFLVRTAMLDVAWAKRAPHDVSLRVATWNLNHGYWASWDDLALRASRFDADVLVVQEAMPAIVQDAAWWQARFPAHQALPLGAGMVVLVRGHAKLVTEGRLRKGGRYRIVDVEARGISFSLMAVDVASAPLLHRRLPLLHVTWLAERLPADKPALVVGDFNTPCDSAFLDVFRDHGWTEAFFSAGRGWSATWPMPVPVLCIDQIWGSPRVRFTGAEVVTTPLSDHRAVVADVVMEAGP
jgi:endonuclease/exonuclease/phosphatase (EEP) superfamily protein YafD